MKNCDFSPKAGEVSTRKQFLELNVSNALCVYTHWEKPTCRVATLSVRLSSVTSICGLLKLLYHCYSHCIESLVFHITHLKGNKDH